MYSHKFQTRTEERMNIYLALEKISFPGPNLEPLVKYPPQRGNLQGWSRTLGKGRRNNRRRRSFPIQNEKYNGWMVIHRYLKRIYNLWAVMSKLPPTYGSTTNAWKPLIGYHAWQPHRPVPDVGGPMISTCEVYQVKWFSTDILSYMMNYEQV